MSNKFLCADVYQSSSNDLFVEIGSYCILTSSHVDIVSLITSVQKQAGISMFFVYNYTKIYSNRLQFLLNSFSSMLKLL